jgi:hypothetical protein
MAFFFGHPKLVACSPTLSKDHRDLMNPRKICSDRQEFFAHLAPQRFTKNVVRICIVQYTTVMSNYLNDQLQADLERDGRVQRGELTPSDASREASEWQEVRRGVLLRGGCRKGRRYFVRGLNGYSIAEN